jgi:hypothetical protein
VRTYTADSLFERRGKKLESWHGTSLAASAGPEGIGGAVLEGRGRGQGRTCPK